MKELLIFIVLFGAAFAGILIGFGIRGIIENNLNKNIKGYRSFWNRNDVISEDSVQ